MYLADSDVWERSTNNDREQFGNIAEWDGNYTVYEAMLVIEFCKSVLRNGNVSRDAWTGRDLEIFKLVLPRGLEYQKEVEGPNNMLSFRS